MVAKAWLELSLEVGPDRHEAVCDRLTEAGALAVTLEAAGNDEVLEPAVGEQPLWEGLRLRALFDTRREPLDLMAAALPQLTPRESRSVSLRLMADQVWERVWLSHFEPLCFGPDQQLWVCPHGQSAPGSGTVIYLDPGLAFGTGTHATTALCLDDLAQWPPEDRSVLDFGCGSGILAIAAKRLGAAQVTAVDNDPQAIQATTDNALRNDAPVQTVLAQDFQGGRFDLVMANILAGVLEQLAAQLVSWIKPGGKILLSGILESQAQSVQSAFHPAVPQWQVSRRDGWVAMAGTRTEGDDAHPVS